MNNAGIIQVMKGVAKLHQLRYFSLNIKRVKDVTLQVYQYIAQVLGKLVLKSLMSVIMYPHRKKETLEYVIPVPKEIYYGERWENMSRK